MEFTAEWQPEAKLWETKNYGRYDEVDYIRIFLGRDQAYIPVKDVLIFETAKGHYRANSFMKQAADSLHYNQIEIIAFDQGGYGREGDYKKILRQCGYPYIEKIALPAAFGKKKCGFGFFKEMTASFGKGKKYGIISNKAELFAVAKHVDFLLYTSPSQYPGRYYLGKKSGEEEQFFENFINEQLLNGTVKESRGYHFGYAFEGILIYAFCSFLKKRIEAEGTGRIYFTAPSSTVFQAYAALHPEEEMETLYVWKRTRRDKELKSYLEKRVEDKAVIVDFSLDPEWKDELEALCRRGCRVLTLCDLFGQDNIRKYGKTVKKAVGMAKENNFSVTYYKNGLPVWEQEEVSIRKLRNGQEIQRGIMEFVMQFEEYRRQENLPEFDCGAKDMQLIEKVLKYAFNEEERKRRHMEPFQALIQSRTAKWGVRLLKSMYRRIRKK